MGLHDSLLDPSAAIVCRSEDDLESTIDLAQGADDSTLVVKSVRPRFATMNVGTMDYGGQGNSCSLKANEILRQCQEECFHIIGVQETRSRESKLVTNGPFTRLISRGDNGQAGVELWIAHQAISEALGADFQPNKDICVWHSDSRILAVRCQIGHTILEWVVIYAPQRGKGQAEQEAWWKEVDQVFKKRDKKALLFILGDCNCSIGSVTSEAIGDMAPDFEDTGGSYLREFCSAYNLIVPSTFRCWHEAG